MSNIVLIHGLWMTPLSWQGWKERFESRGHHVLAPGWPGIDDRDVQAIREDPSALEGLGLEEVIDHYEEIVRGLDSPPIIIGHSFGGLVTQILLDRGLGAAGVGVSASPFKGIVALSPSTLRVVMPALRNPFGKGRTVMLTPSSSTTPSRTRWTPRRRRRSTRACRSPAPRGRCFRPRLRTSTRTRSPR